MVSYNSIFRLLNLASTTYIIILVLLAIIYLIARWKMFEKAEISGWKSLIPLYGKYMEYHTFWNGGFYILNIILMIIGIFMMFGGSTVIFNNIYNAILSNNFSLDFKYIFIGLFSLAGNIVIRCIFTYKKARYYNQYLSFAIALFAMPYIYTLFLGFDPKCNCEKKWEWR